MTDIQSTTPTPTDNPYVMLTFRTSRVSSAAIDAAAAREGIKRSEFIRRAVAHRLMLDEFSDDVELQHAEDEQFGDDQ